MAALRPLGHRAPPVVGVSTTAVPNVAAESKPAEQPGLEAAAPEATVKIAPVGVHQPAAVPQKSIYAAHVDTARLKLDSARPHTVTVPVAASAQPPVPERPVLPPLIGGPVVYPPNLLPEALPTELAPQAVAAFKSLADYANALSESRELSFPEEHALSLELVERAADVLRTQGIAVRIVPYKDGFPELWIRGAGTHPVNRRIHALQKAVEVETVYRPSLLLQSHFTAAYVKADGIVYVPHRLVRDPSSTAHSFELLHELRHAWRDHSLGSKPSPFYGELRPLEGAALPSEQDDVYGRFQSLDEMDTYSHTARFIAIEARALLKEGNTERATKYASTVLAEIAMHGLEVSVRASKVATLALDTLKAGATPELETLRGVVHTTLTLNRDDPKRAFTLDLPLSNIADPKDPAIPQRLIEQLEWMKRAADSNTALFRLTDTFAAHVAELKPSSDELALMERTFSEVMGESRGHETNTAAPVLDESALIARYNVALDRRAAGP